jgi:C4-dicarboxylate-specific signal transduction histidine kinase
VGNTIDMIRLGMAETETQQLLQELDNAMQQVHKATSIISHLRTFGRVASARHEPMILEPVVRGALMLLQEQLRLRQIEVHVDFPSEEVKVQARCGFSAFYVFLAVCMCMVLAFRRTGNR